CALGRWLTARGDADTPPVTMVSRSATDRMPAFSLAWPSPTGVPSPQLDGTADFIERLWTQWSVLEDGLKLRADLIAAMDNIAKLANSRKARVEIERTLADHLASFCAVRGWVALLGETPGVCCAVPSPCGDATGLARDVLQGLMAHTEAKRGDIFEIPEDSDLCARTAELMSVQPEQLQDEGGTLYGIPILTEQELPGGRASRTWIVVAGFQHGVDPPGPTFDRIRLFAQLALTAWDSARRAEEAETKTRTLRESVLALPTLARLVGDSPAAADLKLAILRAAKSDRTVLLIGESGTGKELVAQLIHQESPRSDFGHISRLVATELKMGRQIWKSYNQPGMAPKEIVGAEYRNVPFVDPSEIDERHREWIPVDHPELANAIISAEEEAGLPRQFRHIYRSVLRMLYRAWREDHHFNFFEYDSGASLTGNVATELFGVVPEKYTDVKGGPGRFQVASHCGGTLFLDNIHHLDLSVQRALLKATEIRHEDRRVSRAGGAITEPIQVRLIVATTTDLNELVDQGAFLSEWAARLAGEVIRILPLRQHLQDIPPLARRFAEMCGKQIADDAIRPLQGYDWHGTNVRGVQNAIESAAARTEGHRILSSDVEEAMRSHLAEPDDEPVSPEKVMIQDALRAAKGNKAEAAKIIGWNRQKLYRMMERHGIPRDFGRR
ncbi:hypothetical protein LCGC14_1908100, partial [marine sediment metagenome]